MASPENLVGHVFYQLTVESMLPRERDDSGRLKPARWRCRCTCGGVKELTSGALKAGSAKSCGCRKWIADHSRPRTPLHRPFRQYFNIKELYANA